MQDFTTSGSTSEPHLKEEASPSTKMDLCSKGFGMKARGTSAGGLSTQALGTLTKVSGSRILLTSASATSLNSTVTASKLFGNTKRQKVKPSN